MKPDLNKIIESFNNLNDQARYGVLVACVFVVILLDAFLLVLPQMGAISDLNDQIKQLSDDTQQANDSKGLIIPLKRNADRERTQLEALSTKIRHLPEVPIILSNISSIANEYGVKIDQLTPEKNQQEALKTNGDTKYYTLPIVITAHCGYHMFGHFLNKLENEDMDFILNDFIIQNDDKDPSSRLFSLTIKLILQD